MAVDRLNAETRSAIGRSLYTEDEPMAVQRILLGLVGLTLARGAVAQQPPGIPTTIQLPTFSFFSVNTSVSIPDSGGAYTETARRARLRGSNGLAPAGFAPNRIGPAQTTPWGAATRIGSTPTDRAGRPRATSSATVGSVDEETSQFGRALAAARRSSAGQAAPSTAQGKVSFREEQRAATEQVAKRLARQSTHRP
jgi:hypothetical protein